MGHLVITLGYSVEYSGRDGIIDDRYLGPDARGGGLGRSLLDRAFLEAARLGIHTLHLEIETDNEHAMRLYCSTDFEETGQRQMRHRIID